MKFGLTDQEYQYIKKTVVDPLTRQGARIYCYGSRARGDHKPFSDLDLMIDGPGDLEIEVGKISEVLANGNFPYKVDLVLLKEFADSYRESYETDKILFA